MDTRITTNDKHRTTKTRQQWISKNKTKPSKTKQQQELVIKRSSGRKEKFDTNRMAQTVGRSGVPFLMARDVAKTVSNKIKHESQQRTKGTRKSSNRSKPTQLKEKTVTASRIRNLVSNELRDRNRSDIAASYSGHPPENTLPEENLKDSQPTIADTSATNRNRVLHDQSKRGGGIMT
jgi:transcriptional repressor NrdR